LLGEEVDGKHIAPNIVAAIVDAKGHAVIRTRNSANVPSPHRFDGDTVFQIGSLTKLFTALALTDMAVRGEVALNDPLAKYLPPDVHVPDFAGKPITLLDLVTYPPGWRGGPGNIPKLAPDKP